MEDKKKRSDRVELVVPIRVRGMSAQNKFFDEETETRIVGRSGIMTRVRNLVDLETEIHVTSLKNNTGGTFRVVWVHTHNENGFHNIGLEQIDTEGDLWELHFPGEPADGEVTAEAWLACQRCHQKALSTVPEAEYEYLSEGFLIARPCDRCKATTPWEFAPAEAEATGGAAPPGAGARAAKPVGAVKKMREELRAKGRAPLNMRIKIIRKKYGTKLEDVCDTINVSRNGVYFLSSQNYEPGEQVKVIVPYKEGDVAIALPARVVRQDQPRETFQHAIAIQLLEGRK